MTTHWHYEPKKNQINHLCLDYKKAGANVLSSEVLKELETVLDRIEQAPPNGLVIRSGKPSGFIAGADVNEFLKLRRPEDAAAHIRRVHQLFARIEALPCPTVALVHGFCVGGGLELALACRYIVASDHPSTRLGFPEVRLGIFPGFGGTVRSIRRIGALKAMPLMLTGRSPSAKQAGKLGLVDWVVAERQLDDAATKILTEQPPAKHPTRLETLANNGLIRPLLAWKMARETRKQANPAHYPAPFALIDHWKRFGSDDEALYESETKEVSQLLMGDTARNLIRVFQLQERLKNLGKTSDFKPKHLHVVGGGIMGGDIAAWCALQGLKVSLQDTAPERLTQAMKRAHALFEKHLREPRRIQAAWDRLVPDHKGDGVDRADVIIEAIYEDPDAKRALFHALELKARPNALLATNTSSIPLNDIAKVLKQPDRLIGLHFFNPVSRMQLVEVVRDSGSDPQRIEQGQAFVKRIGRLPLPVKSSPGFLVNRVLMPYLSEAVDLLEEGVPAAAIDDAARRFGMPVGPVELADTVGLDICLAVARELAGHTATPSGIPPHLLHRVENGQLGKKSGRGFYHWENGHAQIPKIPSDYRSPDDLAERLIFRLLNESVACLREGIVDHPDLLDAGIVFGTGFAPFRGGPMHYIDSGGLDRMRQKLDRLHHDHGEHFSPDIGWGGLGHA